MSVIRNVISSKSALANWLSANSVGIFSSVTFSDNVLTCSTSDGDVFVWNMGSSTSGTVYLYREAGNATTRITVSTVPFYSDSSNPMIAFRCDGGIFLTQFLVNSGYTYVTNTIFTKNNHMNHTTIFNKRSGSSGNQYTDIYSVAIGDRTDKTYALSFSPASQFQTQFVPMLTCAPDNSVSYTPCAFYLPVGEFYDIKQGIISCNGNVYVTNGYIALQDRTVIES